MKSQVKSKKKQNTKTSKNTKKYKLKTKIKTQFGHGFLNNVSSSVFSISKKKINYTAPKQTSSNPLTSLVSGTNKTQEFLTIYYNYKAPTQFEINRTTIYDNIKLLTAPHIQITNDDPFLLVMILPSAKPKLLWACDFKWRSKYKTIINYILPDHEVGTLYTILFKLYRYPKNIKKNFQLKNSMVIGRRKAFRRLKKYLKVNNMENSFVPIATKQINVRQVKDTKLTEMFKNFTS